MCNIYLWFLLHKSWGIPSSKKNRAVNVKSICRMLIIWSFTPCQNVNIFGYSQNKCVISYLPTPPPTFLCFWTVNKCLYHQRCSKKTNFVFLSNSPIMTINALMPFCTYAYSFLRKKKGLTNPKLLNGSVIINSNISYVIACINNNQVIQIMLRFKKTNEEVFVCTAVLSLAWRHIIEIWLVKLAILHFMVNVCGPRNNSAIYILYHGYWCGLCLDDYF